MGKYKIETLWGLRELLRANSDLYSPDGYRMIVVSNGIFGGQLLYDHHTKKVYGLCLKEVKNIDDEALDTLKGEYAQEQIKYHMTYKEAIDFLKVKGVEL